MANVNHGSSSCWFFLFVSTLTRFDPGDGNSFCFGEISSFFGASYLKFFRGNYLGKMSLTLLLAVQVIVSLLNGLFDPATKGMPPVGRTG